MGRSAAAPPVGRPMARRVRGGRQGPWAAMGFDRTDDLRVHRGGSRRLAGAERGVDRTGRRAKRSGLRVGRSAVVAACGQRILPRGRQRCVAASGGGDRSALSGNRRRRDDGAAFSRGQRIGRLGRVVPQRRGRRIGAGVYRSSGASAGRSADAAAPAGPLARGEASVAYALGFAPRPLFSHRRLRPRAACVARTYAPPAAPRRRSGPDPASRGS